MFIMTQADNNPDIEALEMNLLLEGIYRHYGFDFRQYAYASLKRRIWHCVQAERLSSISAFQERVLRDPACMERFLLTVSVHTTAMFRDPGFYRALRDKVTPLLHTYPFVRIWIVGCSTGEEVYSTAILLTEEGLYDRCRIYATDMNEAVLQKARQGIYPLKVMQDYTGNYHKAGGARSFSEYYTANYDNAIIQPALQRNVVWAQHNLAVDRAFNEFNLILCRNVLIYFNKPLQSRVYSLLHESLALFGVLGLGSRETLAFSPYEVSYEAINGQERLYRRIR